MTPRPVPKIAAMSPYARADLSVPPGVVPIPLGQNESLRPPSPLAIEAAARATRDGALYPDPDWNDLRAAIADVHGIHPETLLCGAGSMELIGALAHAYLGPGARSLTTDHGYLFFRTAAALAGTKTGFARETNLTVDIDRVLKALAAKTRIVWIANPGNPTGTVIPSSELERLREALPGDVLLVIDEAYGEFADNTPLWHLAERGDTVILRTFSKAYGLAGMRVGWGVFPAAVSTELRKVLNSNNISGPSQAAATAAMSDQAYMAETVAITAAIRDPFCQRARALGLTVPESRTNFALLRFTCAPAAARADAALRARGPTLRGMGGYGLPDCLRATIGEEQHMSVVLETLADAMERKGAA